MKKFMCALVVIGSLLLIGGCCTDDVCNMGTTYTSANTCSSCDKCSSCSTCNTCGYDASYSYSGWY